MLIIIYFIGWAKCIEVILLFILFIYYENDTTLTCHDTFTDLEDKGNIFRYFGGSLGAAKYILLSEIK